MTTFSFGEDFQRGLLRLMMVDDEFCSRALRWISEAMFTTQPLGWMYQTFRYIWDTYNQQPTELTLWESIRALPDGKRQRYAAEFELVLRHGEVAEAAWLREKLAEFVKQALFARAHRETVQPFNEGQQAKAYDIMARAMDEIAQVDFGHVDRVWLFDELADRQRERIRASMTAHHGFRTGLRDLDRLTDGGVQPGELWCVFAYAKRCKTTWLINQGFNATRMGRHPTLHLLLEGQIKQVAARYDACFSGELYQKVKAGEIDAQRYYNLQHEYTAMRKLLVLRRLPGWDNTIDDVRAELSYLRASGFRPQMMITDYMDLGRMRDAKSGASEMQHQVGFARDLKRLHENEGIAGWSAWQAQRPAKDAHTKEHILTSGNVADAYAKVRIVSAYGSLNATDEEMREGVMRYYQEGHRDALVNKVWVIENQLDRMRMVTGVYAQMDPESAQGAAEA